MAGCQRRAFCQSDGQIPNAGKIMKSAYELAMERLSQKSPTVKLTDAQKAKLSELDSKYKAKLAEREIVLTDELAKATAKGDVTAMDKAEQHLAIERRKIQEDLEEKKERVRQGKD